MSNEQRLIETNLTGKISYEILESVMGQLSDGMWENSPAMEGYWRFANIKHDTDTDKIFIVINTASCAYLKYQNKFIQNKFSHMSDNNIREWFANKIKQIVKCELEDISHEAAINNWKRDNMTVLSYIGYNNEIHIADTYKVYDILKGRKSIA